jgi:hypothetical protein
VDSFWSALLGVGAVLALLGALRAGFHTLLLRGLRAPRVAHPLTLSDLNLGGFEVRLAGPNGKTLFAWFVPGLGASPTPAVLVMHGWGANSAMMAACLLPLQQAGMATLLALAAMDKATTKTSPRCHALLKTLLLVWTGCGSSLRWIGADWRWWAIRWVPVPPCCMRQNDRI